MGNYLPPTRTPKGEQKQTPKRKKEIEAASTDSDSDTDAVHPYFTIRNQDESFLDNKYFTQFQTPDHITTLLTTHRSQQDAQKRKSILQERGRRFVYGFSEIEIIDSKITVFSNIFMAAYMPHITRKDGLIRFTLYTQTMLSQHDLYQNNIEGEGIRPNANPELQLALFRKTIRDWIHASGITTVARSKKEDSVIFRSGLFLSFREINYEKKEVNHRLLVLAEETAHQGLCFIIIDNLPYQYYYYSDTKTCVHDKIEKIIKEVGPRYPVYTVKTNFYTNKDVFYTCVSCAFRSAIYAATLQNFSGSEWPENTQERIDYHYRHFINETNRMMQWYFDEPNLWEIDGVWDIRPPKPFFALPSDLISTNEPQDIHKIVTVVRLLPPLAHLRVYDAQNQLTLFYYRPSGPAAFTPGAPHRGSCITHAHFLLS